MSQLKVLLYSGIAFALVFSGFSLVFYYGDWSRLILVSCFGLFLGFLAAPEIVPKAFKKAWVIQLICGAIAGAIVGMAFSLTSTDIASASIVGGFIGWSANLWVKHVPIP
jgi:uncharacterized membrane protein YeaQ/YmgE (transglycosylase-associated protein family)